VFANVSVGNGVEIANGSTSVTITGINFDNVYQFTDGLDKGGGISLMSLSNMENFPYCSSTVNPTLYNEFSGTPSHGTVIASATVNDLVDIHIENVAGDGISTNGNWKCILAQEDETWWTGYIVSENNGVIAIQKFKEGAGFTLNTALSPENESVTISTNSGSQLNVKLAETDSGLEFDVNGGLKITSQISVIQVTIDSTDWATNEATITTTGVTTTNNIIASPVGVSTSFNGWRNNGVRITAQGTDEVTFTCETTPTDDITVSIMIFN
jgi:hypothetical protein